MQTFTSRSNPQEASSHAERIFIKLLSLVEGTKKKLYTNLKKDEASLIHKYYPT